MHIFLRSVFLVSLFGSFSGGVAQAKPSDGKATHRKVRHYKSVTYNKHSRFYCVSTSPVNMQSSGEIGYGHGSTPEEAAALAVADCGRNGAFGCGAADCFQE